MPPKLPVPTPILGAARARPVSAFAQTTTAPGPAAAPAAAPHAAAPAATPSATAPHAAVPAATAPAAMPQTLPPPIQASRHRRAARLPPGHLLAPAAHVPSA